MAARTTSVASLIAALVFAAGDPAAGASGNDASPQAGAKNAGAPDAGLFDRLDADADGFVSPGEVPEGSRRLLDRLLRASDQDGDGRLDRSELQAGLTPSTPDKPIAEPTSAELRGAKFARLLLVRLDANRDQTLTRGEAPPGLADVFEQIVSRADRNDDDRVSRYELNRAGPQLVNLGRRVAKVNEWNVDAELRRLEREQGEAVYRFDTPIGPMEALANPKRAKELFYRLDANGDGALTKAELPPGARERMQRVFRRADENRDGRLTRKEYLTAAERLAKFLERNDIALPNRDRGEPGKPSSPAPSATPADKPTDKTPTAAPAAAMAEEPARTESAAERFIGRLVARADRDGNGRITRDEAVGPLARRFARADANGDGELDAAELAAEADRLDARLRRAAARKESP